jgi:hypothetical protein
LPRMMVTVSPCSTASSRSEKCRDASVAVMTLVAAAYLIIRFLRADGSRRQILASVPASRQLALLDSREEEHIVRLSRAQVEFDPRDEEEITERLRARLRQYRRRARGSESSWRVC